MKRTFGIYGLFGGLLVIALVLAILAGGLGNIQAYACKSDAEALGLKWQWSRVSGCMVLTPSGAWLPLNKNRHPQVPLP